MKAIVFSLLLFFRLFLNAQQDTSALFAKSLLKNLKVGDSVIYYQCHVEQAIQQLTTVSGQTLVGKPDKYSITEKYTVIRQKNGYTVNYFSSAMTAFPNRRFSGLKVRERDYWLFKYEKSFPLSDQDVKVLLALERKGHEATEYDFTIDKYNTNQLIIKKKKNFKQLVIEGNYVLSKLIIH